MTSQHARGRHTGRRATAASLVAAAVTAAVTPVLSVAVLPVALPATVPSASALSCINSTEVVSRPGHLFTGQLADVEDGRFLVNTLQQRAGDDVPAQVWLAVDLLGWTPWRELRDAHEVEAQGLADEVWLFHSDDDEWRVDACSFWPADDFASYTLEEEAPRVSTLVPEMTGANGVVRAPEPSEGFRDGHTTRELTTAAVGGLLIGLGALIAGLALRFPRRALTEDLQRGTDETHGDDAPKA